MEGDSMPTLAKSEVHRGSGDRVDGTVRGGTGVLQRREAAVGVHDVCFIGVLFWDKLEAIVEAGRGDVYVVAEHVLL